MYKELRQYFIQELTYILSRKVFEVDVIPFEELKLNLQKAIPEIDVEGFYLIDALSVPNSDFFKLLAKLGDSLMNTWFISYGICQGLDIGKIVSMQQFLERNDVMERSFLNKEIGVKLLESRNLVVNTHSKGSFMEALFAVLCLNIGNKRTFQLFKKYYILMEGKGPVIEANEFSATKRTLTKVWRENNYKPDPYRSFF